MREGVRMEHSAERAASRIDHVLLQHQLDLILIEACEGVRSGFAAGSARHNGAIVSMLTAGILIGE